MIPFKKEDEIIVVVKRDRLFKNEELTFQGFTANKYIVNLIMENIDGYYESMRRGGTKEDINKLENAELNFDYVQPIPYIVIKRGNSLYATQRLQGGGESRLHGKIALGAGGHMNPLSEDEIEEFDVVLRENTQRELDEELSITGEYKINIIGLINDDSDDVNKVHIGILGLLELEDSGEVKVLENEQLEGNWFTVEQLQEQEIYDRLENWAKIVLEII